jgi:hypothetical protein
MRWITATQCDADNTPVLIWINLASVQWMRRDTRHPAAHTLLYFGGGPGINVTETPEELLRRAQVHSPESYAG